MADFDLRETREDEDEAWATRMVAHGEASIDAGVVAQLREAPNTIFLADGSTPDKEVVTISRSVENQNMRVTRLYPEGMPVRVFVPTVLAALEEAARRWPDYLDRQIYCHFLQTKEDLTPRQDLQRQHEKGLAWQAICAGGGGHVTVELVTLSGGIRAWQAGSTLRDARDSLRVVLPRLPSR